MAVQTVEQVQRLAPYLEGLEKRLLQSAFGTFDDDGTQTQKGLLDRAITLPQQQVAGLDPLQQKAYQPQRHKCSVLMRHFLEALGKLLALELPLLPVVLACLLIRHALSACSCHHIRQKLSTVQWPM